jgi:putative membrane-bound dehydrogenase-like protein
MVSLLEVIKVPAKSIFCLFFCVLFGLAAVMNASAGEFELKGQRFTLPDGFQIERIAGPPMVERPVSADFDERGRLYVTDSSGSNEHVDIQREKRPHRIVRLQDDDGDGVFDSSTVFADRLMFPEGALWYDGSLYVAAPPEIWKFTDADQDGVAEQREVWFDGQTLTHCANDLHGPYLGPDGWFYWCKGAFAEQVHERWGRKPLRSSAAHIFRRHPSGGPIEIVMTGGMDNPVEIAFTPAGERIFTTTFLVNPAGGKRDGLIHAIYGGVYGKSHDVLAGHSRTGELMPVLTHLGVAAPCGLTRLETAGLGDDFRHNLLSSAFNLHKIIRHELSAVGASYETRDSDLLVSDNLDFHPTDVLEDADGSVIVVDTGGWFRLCCPTSQLEKPDVLGGIYRIRRHAAPQVADPRGSGIEWSGQSPPQLVDRLTDHRWTVRNRARQSLSRIGVAVIPLLSDVIDSGTDSEQRLQSVWALASIDDPRARAAVRSAIDDDDATVRQAALHAVSLSRDEAAGDRLVTMLSDGSPRDRRAAAEALGRIGNRDHVAPLLSAAANAPELDRALEHSLIYAAIEINDPDAIRPLLAASDRLVRRAALLALDQLEEGDHLSATEIQPLLVSEDTVLNETAWWIAAQHPDWGDVVAAAFAEELSMISVDPPSIQRLAGRLSRFSGSKKVQALMAESLSTEGSHPASKVALKVALVDAMAASGQRPLPARWQMALMDQLSADPAIVAAALRAIDRLSTSPPNKAMIPRLQSIVDDSTTYDDSIRLQAIRLIPTADRTFSDENFQLVCQQLNVDRPVANRSLAIDILQSSNLSSAQLQQISQHFPQVGTMELRPLIELFTRSDDETVGRSVVESLLNSPAATTLVPEQLITALAGYGEAVVASAQVLVQRIEAENRNKVARMDAVLERLPQADVRRGLKVFQSPAAACIACHSRGYLGGDVGPDLDGIGQARSERDLLESILFPSLTFVRNYEPAAVLTVDGQIYNGVIRETTDDTITLQIDAQKSMVIPRDEIEETRFSDVSIMPAGLEKQLSPQDLADLVKYLKEG